MGRISHFFRRLLQPLRSKQYFVGVRKFNDGDYMGAAEELRLITEGVYRTSVLYRRLSDFYYHRSLRNAAISAFYRGEYLKAIQQSKTALAIVPNDKVCLNYLAHSYHHVGQYGASIKMLQRLDELEDGRSDVKLNLAKILIKAERMEEAIAILDGLLDVYRNYADFHLIRGIAEAKSSDADAAIRSFRTATQINPEYSKGIMLLGLEQVRQTRYREALETFRQGMQRCPDDTDMIFYYGLVGSVVSRLDAGHLEVMETGGVQKLSGDLDDQLVQDISFLDHRSVQERKMLLDLDISYGEHFTYLDPVYDKPLLRSLISVFEELIQTFPEYADYCYKLANFYLKSGEIVRAERYLLMALDINPTYTDALSLLAELYESENRLEEALALITTILQSESDNADHQMMKGRLLVKLDRPEEAIEYFLSSRELDQRYVYSLYQLGHILLEKQKPEQTIRCWRELVSFLPGIQREMRKVQKQLARKGA